MEDESGGQGERVKRQWARKVGIKGGGAAVLERGLSRFIGCALGERALPWKKNRNACVTGAGTCPII